MHDRDVRQTGRSGGECRCGKLSARESGEAERERDQVTREREEMRAREQKKALERLKEPEAWEWALDLPNVTAKDL
jgi:hypothetical protein